METGLVKADDVLFMRFKPTGSGTIMLLDEVLKDLKGPGSDIVHAGNSVGLSGKERPVGSRTG